jgi:hypothetical protein
MWNGPIGKRFRTDFEPAQDGAFTYVRPFDAGFPLAMMNSATSASLIKFARCFAR